MKILICTGIYPPETGGPATFANAIAQKLSLKGHRVSVLTYSSDKLEGGSLYPVFFVSRAAPLVLRYLNFFLNVLWHGSKADCLFVLDTLSAGYPTYLANKFLRKKMVVRVVGDHAWEQAYRVGITQLLLNDFQNEKNLPKKILKMRALQAKVVSAASNVIVPSKYLASIVSGWGAKQERIDVVNNAVYIPDMKITKTQARSDLGISRGEFFVVSIGRDVPWKGFEVLRGAVDELKEAGEKVKLNIYSSVPREEVLKALAAADTFVLNTGYEGFSHVLIEAMAQGVPVITTDAGGNKEVVVDGENGIFIPFNDKDEIKNAIVRLKGDTALRKKLSKNGKETARKFTVERMVEETEKVLVENI